jgi:hypothetical protein
VGKQLEEFGTRLRRANRNDITETRLVASQGVEEAFY